MGKTLSNGKSQHSPHCAMGTVWCFMCTPGWPSPPPVRRRHSADGEQAHRSQANLTEAWLIKAELEWSLCGRPETTAHAPCCSSPSSFSAASLASALEKGRVLCVRSTKKIFVKHAWMPLMHFYSWETHVPHCLRSDPRARNGPLGRCCSSSLRAKGFSADTWRKIIRRHWGRA